MAVASACREVSCQFRQRTRSLSSVAIGRLRVPSTLRRLPPKGGGRKGPRQVSIGGPAKDKRDVTYSKPLTFNDAYSP